MRSRLSGMLVHVQLPFVCICTGATFFHVYLRMRSLLSCVLAQEQPSFTVCLLRLWQYFQVDDEGVAEELFREQAGHQSAPSTTTTAPSTTKLTPSAATAATTTAAAVATTGGELDRWADIYEDMPMRRKMALYDYDPRELSPNVDSEVELSFRTGDIITIYGEMDDDGFYMGELHGGRGLVPSNFLADIPSGLDGKMMLRHLQQASGAGGAGMRSPVTAAVPAGGGYGGSTRAGGIKPSVAASSRW